METKETVEKTLNHNEVVKFMKEFKVDFLNRFGELIIDSKTNTFADINHCKDMDDVETTVVFALCRPIGKGLKKPVADNLLTRVNEYFDADLTREDMHLMYAKLCYINKFDDFKSFVKRGFPMGELLFPNYKEDE